MPSIKQDWPVLLVFLAVVLGMGAVVGLVATPGNYLGLKLPALVIPEAVSGAIGLILSAAFAVAGWRCWMINSASLQMRLWLATLIFSWWFSPAFFIARMPPLALLIVLGMLALTLWFEVLTWRRDRPSFWLVAPSVVYTGYIAAVTAAIVAMN